MGNGTHWLPRSASYSTSTRRPPGARIARIAASTRTRVADVVEAVRRQHAVERARWQPGGEVACVRLDDRPGKPVGDAAGEPLQGLPVAIHGDDRRRCTEHVGEREGERPVACAELQPARAGARDPVPDQRDVVGMVHLGTAGPRLPADDAGDEQAGACFFAMVPPGWRRQDGVRDVRTMPRVGRPRTARSGRDGPVRRRQPSVRRSRPGPRATPRSSSRRRPCRRPTS